MRHLPLLLFAFAPGGCGDLDVRPIRPASGVPAALEGEWVGTWRSSSDQRTGPLVVRVQQFRGEPVVAVQLDNPCVTPRDYELVLRAATIELRADGETVLAAVLGEGRTLDGMFQCAADVGEWTATWARPLPAIADLAGAWEGTLSTAGAPQQQLQLELEQQVRGGAIELLGTLELPESFPLPLPVRGSAVFRSEGFDLFLRAEAASLPTLVLSGRGDHEPLQIGLGLVQAFGPMPLPFTQGVFELQWRQP